MATNGGVTYSNSGTAVDDYFVLTADMLSAQWNVMLNDGGGTKTTMYSLDDGTNDSGLTPTGGITFDMDLLASDMNGADNTTSGGIDLLGKHRIMWAEAAGWRPRT